MSDVKEQIEKVFRESNDPEELFDYLRIAISEKICDADLYKILLANPVLSNDEIIMFTEKITEEFENCSYELFMWTAQIFEDSFVDYSHLERSIYYYQKAAIANSLEYAPYLAALQLYSYELPLPTNESIMQLVNTGVSNVKIKSKIYFALADHFAKLGNIELKRKYSTLAQKAVRKENQ
jgi:hypothetical protein